MNLASKGKKFKFWRVHLGETPHCGSPNFSRALFLHDIFNHSNFEYSGLSGLKVDSRRRIIKKKKKEEK